MKWEYTVYRMNNAIANYGPILAQHGEEGWELVSVVPQPPHTNLIFKRQKTSEQKKAA